MRLTVYGAGAVGLVMGARLARTGDDVLFLTRRSEVAETLAREGVRFEDPGSGSSFTARVRALAIGDATPGDVSGGPVEAMHTGAASLDLPDEEAIARARDGDHEAYRVLVERYQGRAYRLATRVLGDPDWARDAVQEGFLKAYGNLHQYRPEHPFSTWLYRLAANLVLDRGRRAKKERGRVEMPEQLVDNAPSARANLVACVDGGVVDTCWRERVQWTGDLRMSAIALRAFQKRSSLVRWGPTWSTRPVRRTASRHSSACWTVRESGFSQKTSFPASMASIAIFVCQWSGVAIRTASTSGSSSTSRYSIVPLDSEPSMMPTAALRRLR